MSKEDSKLYVWILLALGTLVSASGFTLVGLYTVQGNFLLVALGFFLFVIGYKLCWFAAHDISTLSELSDAINSVLVPENRVRELKFHILTVTGVIMVSYGATEFAQIIVADGQMNPAVAGFIVFTGYMIAHEGVNRVLV